MERVQVVVAPAAARGAAHVPRRSVIGEDHAVALERPQHDPRLAREARDVVAALEPQPLAHGRQVRVRQVGREVARRIDERPPGPRGREAERVVDAASAHLRVSRQPRQDRQPGGVRRGVPARAQPVGAQVEDRPRAGVPPLSTVERMCVEQFVEPAARAIHHEHVAVAVRAAAALDRRPRRDRIAPAVGLVRVLEAHRHALLSRSHRHVRDPDRPSRVAA